eukprot:TRINITY_DN694_c0_g1_i2.p1 TRINITY_DN694_c0_g1~~TRINITY_DN694_c0_g1_i2.p1  ORF type:complete len:293 (+),score=105.97 TRINITY_DN694_c0_g1_i2:463-1341(+)
MTYVALFAISYHPCSLRTMKPFNPLLGETYEYREGDFKFYSEQVSHHPPVGAMYAEGKGFQLWKDQGIESKFQGNSLRVDPVGRTVCKIMPSGNVYEWNYITATANNILVGKTWVDMSGEMIIKNVSTGEKAQLIFSEYGWLSRSLYQVKCSIFDNCGRFKVQLSGKWDEAIYLVEAPQSIAWQERADVVSGKQPIWRHTDIASETERWGFSPFVKKLNLALDGVAPTDSRNRMDRKALENGDTQLAQKLKAQIEDKQRADERNHTGHTPQLFHKGLPSALVGGEPFWVFKK